jgi:alpha-1,3/alpha-1,6-mannosyltransferase
VPLLRWCLQTRVVFYCHFPDKLLSGNWDLTTAGSQAGPTKKEVGGLRDLLKGLYRLPVDLLEEFSTGACLAAGKFARPSLLTTTRVFDQHSGQADVILANSLFTSRVYKSAFSSLKSLPEVIYPGLDLSAFTPLTLKEAKNSEVKLVASYVLQELLSL